MFRDAVQPAVRALMPQCILFAALSRGSRCNRAAALLASGLRGRVGDKVIVPAGQQHLERPRPGLTSRGRGFVQPGQVMSARPVLAASSLCLQPAVALPRLPTPTPARSVPPAPSSQHPLPHDPTTPPRHSAHPRTRESAIWLKCTPRSPSAKPSTRTGLLSNWRPRSSGFTRAPSSMRQASSVIQSP